MPGEKEWLIGAPEFKDQSYALEDLKRLIKEKKVLGTDLVLKEGGVWRSARDYPELSNLFGDDATATRSGPKIVIEPPRADAAVAPPRPARLLSSGSTKSPTGVMPAVPAAPKVLRKTTVVEPAKPPLRKTQIIVPAPKPPEPAPPPPPPPDKSKAETSVDQPVAAPAAPAPAPAPETAEPKPAEAPPVDLSKHETQVSAPPKITVKRERRPPPPPKEPVIVALEVTEFTLKDLGRGMWKIVYPVNVIVSLSMALLCLFLSRLFDVTGAGYVVSAFLFFASFAVLHGILAFTTRCEIEKASGLPLILPYVKQSWSLAVSVLLSLALGFMSLGLGVARQIDPAWASFAILCIVSIAFVLAAMVFVMTAGYWNAILAVEVCGPGHAVSLLLKVYRHAFRAVLGHSALGLVFAFAGFAVLTLPSLAVAMLCYGNPKPAVDISFFLLPVNFGVGMALAVSTLATSNVLSYIYIRKNRIPPPAPPPGPAAPPPAAEKKDEVPVESTPAEKPKGADTTQMEIPVVPETKPAEPKPPEGPPPAG